MNGNVNSLHQGNPVNDQHPYSPSRRSTFNLSYGVDMTLRFGEITPFFVGTTVPNDKFHLQSIHRLRTFSMQSPLMQSVSMKKDYFAVPLQAILPLQFDRIYANPNIGDDVPADAYTTVDFVSSIGSKTNTLLSSFRSVLNDSTSSASVVISSLFRSFFCLEYFYSNGCLLNYLGCNLNGLFISTSTAKDFDSVFDSVSLAFVNNVVSCNFEINGDAVVYGGDSGVSFRRLLEICRDNGYLITNVSGIVFRTGKTNVTLINDLKLFISGCSIDLSVDRPIDLAPVFAYQIICAHYYSNDRVDYIYSAELYRELVNSIVSKNGSITKTFSYNGVQMPYDYCSSHYLNGIFSFSNTDVFLELLSVVFAFRHSLRFVDYFTGSKTRPLAVGNTDVNVNQGLVSVIDVTRKIQAQRFLNAVNRTGRKIGDYISGLFPGVTMDYDYHDPMYLGHTNDNLFADETQNTGDAQLELKQTVTSVLKANSSRFAFEFKSDRPSIIIGLTYFDLKRMYGYSTDRIFFHKDRFDMFNPFLEFVGDQPIYRTELSSKNRGDASNIFGYTTRYMEYKQRVNRCVGGFVKNLPGFTFVADADPINLPSSEVISPDYIRSSSVELDPFFVQLTGYSLSSYFHFIISFDNVYNGSRPMSYNPQIL